VLFFLSVLLLVIHGTIRLTETGDREDAVP
jgi:hypothetical protein